MTQTCTPTDRITNSLLGYGVIAGPFYVVVSLAQALSRDGFRLDTHSWSLLANGPSGWIQIANFILTGLMTVAAAVGLHRALAPGRGHVWAPLLIGVYGLSLIGAGVFRADPAQGFPAGAPDVPAVSWHGMLHFVVGGIGFLCLVVAAFILAGRFTADGFPRLAWFSRGVLPRRVRRHRQRFARPGHAGVRGRRGDHLGLVEHRFRPLLPLCGLTIHQHSKGRRSCVTSLCSGPLSRRRRPRRNSWTRS
jgi:hypothetical protein